MKHIPVVSSNIHSIGYDAQAGDMEVKFKSGTTYRYSQVPPDAWSDFVSADSVGSHFAKRIRPHFEGVKLGEQIMAHESQ